MASTRPFLHTKQTCRVVGLIALWPEILLYNHLLSIHLPTPYVPLYDASKTFSVAVL